MTTEEIDIIVNTSVEKAVKEFEKLAPSIKKQIEIIKKQFDNINLKGITANIDLKEVNKQIKTAKKQIKETFDPNDISGMTINGNTFEIKNIAGYSKEMQKLKGHILGIKKEEQSIGNIQIKKPIKINTVEKNESNAENTNVPSVTKLSSWDTLKSKVSQIVPAIRQFKQGIKQAGGSKELEQVKYKISEIEEKLENAKEGKIHLNTKEIIETEAELERLNNKKDKLEKGSKRSPFSGLFSGLKKITPSMDNISGMTIKIKNQIKQWSSGMKSGLGHVLKYAGALFSLQSIYSTLSGCANTWLSSQNAGAKQLSANIEYMKYAMGSALAPIIQFITNLVYQLMKAIQSVAYAMTGVNIFANASAKAFKNAQKEAKNTSKQLSSIHSEINNVGDHDSSTSPNVVDISKLNPSNSLLDAIKKGNWYEVGSEIGQKLNDALDKIDWSTIQNKAKNIATNIAQFLNGFIKTTNWNQVGNTFAQGINAAIYFAYNFVTTFDWKQFGKSIGDSINGFFNNIDWSIAGQTLSEGIKGILNTISTILETINWQQLAKNLEEFVTNIDWSGIAQGIFRGIGAALGGLAKFLGTLISDAFNGIEDYFNDKIEECGGNVVAGIFKGIADAIVGVGQWIYDNIFVPFIDGFKNAFGIHSPSTVMIEMGGYIIEGLKNGLLGIWDKVKQPFVDFKNNVTNKLTEIKSNISNWSSNTKATISNWGNDIKNKISSTWSNASQNVSSSVNALKNNISTGLNSAKSTVSNWGDSIKNTFSNLGRNASTWGKDLADNMASGIKNNIHKVTSAVNSVADRIKDYLHFSEPDIGPLSNFHTYMPDMIDLMVKGIKDNASKVKNEIENLAGTMSYTIDTNGIGNSVQTNDKIGPVRVQSQNLSETLEDILASQGNNRQPLHITIQYLGKDIFDDTIDYINSKTRRTGKNTIVTVGD